jgi:hypothetical protein
MPELHRKLPSYSVTSAIKTLAESKSAPSGPREPGKATSFGFADLNNRNGGSTKLTALFSPEPQARS